MNTEKTINTQNIISLIKEYDMNTLYSILKAVKAQPRFGMLNTENMTHYRITFLYDDYKKIIIGLYDTGEDMVTAIVTDDISIQSIDISKDCSTHFIHDILALWKKA